MSPRGTERDGKEGEDGERSFHGVILHRGLILRQRLGDNGCMVLAQAAAEYVGVSSVMEGLSGLWYAVEYQLSRLGSSGYAVLGLALLAFFFLRSRR